MYASQNIHTIPIGIHCHQLWWNVITISKPNGDLSIVCHMEFSLALADKSYFGGCHTFQHCSNTFKLNKHAKCLSLSIRKQLINVDGIELKPSDVHKSWSIVTASSFVFSAVASYFPQLLKCDTIMVASYCVVP